MDTATLTAIIQGIVQIITIIGSIWAIFNKKTNDIQDSVNGRISSLENQIKLYNQNLTRREELLRNTGKFDM